jgi:topoisomerase-4 subunit A
VSVGEGDALVTAVPLPPEAKEVAALSAEGRLLVFPLDEVPELANGGRGVTAIKLHDNETMLGVRAVAGELQVAAIGRGDKRVTLAIGAKDLAHYRGSRARSGRKLAPYFKKVERFE